MSAKTRVLVVDDEEVVRLSILRVLAGAGCEVEAVANGAEALREMERRPYDVVLLDLRMPGMDGMSVLKTIKHNWPDSEVVVITGYPTIGTAKEAIKLRAYDYISKPVDPDDVIRAASGAMLQKSWSLHRDNKRQAAEMGARACYH